MAKDDDSLKKRGETALCRQKVNFRFSSMRNGIQSSEPTVHKVSN